MRIRWLLASLPICVPDAALRAQSYEILAPASEVRLTDVVQTHAGAFMQDHPHALPMPVAGVRLPDGRVALAAAHGTGIVILDLLHHEHQVVANAGSTWGKFQHIGWLGRCGSDSVYVWDVMRRRMVVLTPTGHPIREFALADDTLSDAPTTVACSSQGQFAFQAFGHGAEAPSERGEIRGSAPVVVRDLNGNRVHTIPNVASAELVRFGQGAGPAPLGKVTTFAFYQGSLYVGTADSPKLDMYDLDHGVRRTVVPVPLRRRAPSATQYAEAVDDIVDMVRAPMNDIVRQYLSSLPQPDSLPYYQSIQSGRDGLLWIVESASGGTDTRLVGVDANGVVRRRLSLPERVRVFEVGRDYVLGADRDRTGRVRLRMYAASAR